MQEPQNVDGVLFNHPTQARMADIQTPPAAELTHSQDEPMHEIDSQDVPRETINSETEQQLAPDTDNVPRETIQSEVNDYGIEVEKKPEKTYTESEVNQMIRDRLSRGKYAETKPQQQYSQQPQQQYDNAGEDWQSQLSEFVNREVELREERLRQEDWKQRVQIEQAQFEVKFNSGAAKYSDFENVVHGKPLTPQMVMATKNMSDPAGFIYAAAKTQEAELGRISQIQDPMTQAMELGRLEERMRRSRPLSTSAPKPIGYSVGDVAEKAPSKGDTDIPIESRIQQYSDYKFKRRTGS